MSYGHGRNTGIPYLRNYNEALAKFESTKPIRGGGANGGRIALGHRHRVAEFYMTKTDKGAVECMCYRTPVVTFHPDGNIELRSGGWSSTTTAQFIEDVLPVSCRVNQSSLVVGFNGGFYRFRGEGLMLGWVNGRLSPLNVEPDHVYRVNRKEANNVRKKYAEFIKFFTGMTKLRGEDVITDEEFIRMFGADESRGGHTTKAQMPSDIALRNKEQVESMFAMMESDDHEMRYKACLLIIKQFGKRHYWQNMGYSITPESVRKALNDLVFARHKDVVFDVVEVPLGTIKKDSWSHLF
jgi:hypothetical protein